MRKGLLWAFIFFLGWSSARYLSAEEPPPPILYAVPAEHQPPHKPATIALPAERYYCGARTKKGTRCTRKVKGQVRCWQHAGRPAVVAADQLKVEEDEKERASTDGSPSR